MPELEPLRVGADKFGADFKKDHPLRFEENELAARTGDDAGYYNGPIAGAFLRAPYLHNASILTLAELVGLEPRRAKFYRGRNPYDLKWGGFQSPDVPAGVDAANPVPKDKDYYFVFDTAVRGNSNKGHEYPDWGFTLKKDESLPADKKKQLDDLIEYLNSL